MTQASSNVEHPRGLQRWRGAAAQRLASARLQLDKLRFGRPDGLMSVAQLRTEHPEWWKLAFEANHQERRAPIRHGLLDVSFDNVVPDFPDLGTVTMPGGYLLGAQGWAFTPSRRFLAEASWYGAEATASQLPRAFGRVQHLPGTCLSIATDFAHNNFGHYVLDCLSRLELFKQTGGRLEDVDHVFLPPPPGRSARRALQMMGVPEKKCAWATPGSWVKAEKLIVTSFPGLKRNYPDWLPRALQQYFPELPRSSTRVYMPRTGSRRAINEAELIEIAREFGFEVYDHEKCAGEPEFFSSVEAVVGAHGAQLTNLAWCRPGTKVLELISSDHRYPYYYTVADSAQLEYHCLGGQSLESRPPGSTAPSLFDFHVDPTEFRETLVAMGL